MPTTHTSALCLSAMTANFAVCDVLPVRPRLLGALPDTGLGRITGTVRRVPNVPTRARVCLIREEDGVLIREMMSHSVTGAYSFEWIDQRRRYSVVAYDPTGTYNAVIASNRQPD